MKGFISLLKGRKFRSGKTYNSSFLLKTPKEEKEEEKLYINTDNFPKKNNLLHSSLNKLLKNKKFVFVKPKKAKINEDYEDLFLYFLKKPGKINDFEFSSQTKKKLQNNFLQINNNDNNESKFQKEDEDYSNEEEPLQKDINIKQIFYQEIYLNFANNKLIWNNFSFPKGVYSLMYQKSRKKQKEILKYSLKHNKKYENIINSYEKIYTSSLKKHNWELNPHVAYINYSKIIRSNNLSQSKQNSHKHLDLRTNYSDIVIKVDNNGKDRTLMYIGKLFNIYIEDYLKDKNNDEIISMQTQEQKPKKEIIYNYNQLLKKAKLKLKMNYSFTNNKSISNLSNKNNIKFLSSKIKQKYNINLILNTMKNKKKSSDSKNIIDYEKCNTELNRLSKGIFNNNNSFSSNFNLNDSNIFNNLANYALTDKNKNKEFFYKIEKYKNNINKIKINDEEMKKNKNLFSPTSFKSYKPIILNEHNINTNNSNEKNQFYSKLALKKKFPEQIKNEFKKNNIILNYFKKNTSDFYYL